MLTLALTRQVEARGDAAEWLRLAAYSEALFIYYASQVPLIFAYKLAANAENERRGIAGRSSGFRRGVRNLNYVPAAQHPAAPSAQPLGATIRYYDLGRQRWRSFRKGCLVTISAFWSEAEQRFVDTPEAAGITQGVPFHAAPREAAAIDGDREARSARRAEARRDREAERRTNNRTTDRAMRAERRLTNLQSRVTRQVYY